MKEDKSVTINSKFTGCENAITKELIFFFRIVFYFEPTKIGRHALKTKKAIPMYAGCKIVLLLISTAQWVFIYDFLRNGF